ncbi:hypothetical protein [Neisseria dumasiana]|nr:hypothetical protein [Neisseria dumasiana]
MTRFSNRPLFVPACLPLLPACGFTQADHPPVNETVELDTVYVTAERGSSSRPAFPNYLPKSRKNNLLTLNNGFSRQSNIYNGGGRAFYGSLKVGF